MRESTVNHNSFISDLLEQSEAIQTNTPTPNYESSNVLECTATNENSMGAEFSSETSENELNPSTILANVSHTSSANLVQITQSQYITLLCKLSDLKRQLTRVEVKIDQKQCVHSKSLNNEHITGTVDIAQLDSFGLSVKTNEQLDEFEAKLKTESFRNSVVGLIFFSSSQLSPTD